MPPPGSQCPGNAVVAVIGPDELQWLEPVHRKISFYVVFVSRCRINGVGDIGTCMPLIGSAGDGNACALGQCASQGFTFLVRRAWRHALAGEWVDACARATFRRRGTYTMGRQVSAPGAAKLHFCDADFPVAVGVATCNAAPCVGRIEYRALPVKCHFRLFGLAIGLCASCRTGCLRTGKATAALAAEKGAGIGAGCARGDPNAAVHLWILTCMRTHGRKP